MKKWTDKQKKKVKRLIALVSAVTLIIILLLAGVLSVFHSIQDKKQKEKQAEQSLLVNVTQPDIEVALLTPNVNSRPRLALEEVKGIVIHYTANPGSDAMANRNYFEGRKNLPDEKKNKVSSHFIIGLDGKIVQCIPLDEMAYASNDRNKDTISIECCHPDKSGKFSTQTYTALVQLSAWLCGHYGLDESAVIRHYDVTGKKCPKYYVKHEDAWKDLKKEIFKEIERYRTLKK
ncbi:MAG: N-acetylmuramoyl-L-alanine amidase [Lachnospiraceae bacterium]|nr:N-acetylmuramoyl-L-alanine amidase [Lachnospiraceae bacterium]